MTASSTSLSRRAAALGLAAWLCASLSGCVTATFFRVSEEAPPADEAVESLVVGEAGLADALAELGAPIQVRELEDGAVLAWGWLRRRFWGVTLSVPVSRRLSGNLTYNKSAADVEGIVLFFDADWRLVELRRGYLLELLLETRPPPQLVE